MGGLGPVCDNKGLICDKYHEGDFKNWMDESNK
jgi:hypothetical protein